MASYEIEVASFCEAQITGRMGTAIVTFRGHTYRVALGAAEVTRDGYPCGVDVLPAPVYAFAVRQYDALAKAHLEDRRA